ncbi:MAG: VOC family protein [Myxococcota bacterium]
MRFGYTILYVPDVEEAIAFYERAFGLRRRFVHESGDYGELDTGSTTLSFASEALVRSGGVDFRSGRVSEASLPIEIAFVTDDVSAAFRKALDAGAVQVLEPEQKPWGQTVSYVRDLNGFLVEMCTPVGTTPASS